MYDDGTFGSNFKYFRNHAQSHNILRWWLWDWLDIKRYRKRKICPSQIKTLSDIWLFRRKGIKTSWYLKIKLNFEGQGTNNNILWKGTWNEHRYL